MESRTDRKTKAPRRIATDVRTKNLVELLDRELDATLARVRKLRKEEEKDAIALPADGLDVAHSLEEVEMEAGPVERYEDRLRAIDDAFNRLERGRYGICEKCKQEIPIERLKAMPLAAYCVGPRGLASIVLGLVYLEQEMNLPGEPAIRSAVMVTVLLSIFAHGLSAIPAIDLYTRGNSTIAH